MHGMVSDGLIECRRNKVEKQFVMAWLKQTIVGGVAAVMMTAVLVPLAHAGDQDERELRAARRDRIFPQRQVHRQHDAQPVQQRLSPEERRQLRRDIKDAGREIYPPPR